MNSGLKHCVGGRCWIYLTLIWGRLCPCLLCSVIDRNCIFLHNHLAHAHTYYTYAFLCSCTIRNRSGKLRIIIAFRFQFALYRIITRPWWGINFFKDVHLIIHGARYDGAWRVIMYFSTLNISIVPLSNVADLDIWPTKSADKSLDMKDFSLSLYSLRGDCQPLATDKAFVHNTIQLVGSLERCIHKIVHSHV